jgi:alpha-glucosidase
VFESALQMLADHPGAYEGQKELAFLKAVPAVWDETRGVAGRPGEYAVVARRSGQTWFLGGITNHDGRALEVPLDFLPAGDFTAEVYGDAGSPAATEVKSQKVTRTGKLSVRLAPTGGFAAILRPAR